MNVVGELGLLGAFVASGFAAFACVAGGRRNSRGLLAAGKFAAVASLAALSVVTFVLGWALVAKDFRYAYVAQYSSVLLPWHYSLSALWVGQAGSLLLWAWLSAVVALLLGLGSRREAGDLRGPAFGLLMGYVCFLTAIMIFAADPMELSVTAVREGAGLSPLLQHPAMLIHPPVVFLGYTLWAVPFALAAVALVSGQLDATWIRLARPWALAAWAVLGAGILLGADWAYEELGWGGYWAWDPVENGSLMPWLTGTALIHYMMAWQYRRIFKRSALALAFATFGLCNFATFLTRSGIFSSLHAFSASPIGWLFLMLMISLTAVGAWFLVSHRRQLQAEASIDSLLSREAGVLISTTSLLLLTAVTMAGTLATALSLFVVGRTVMVGPAFYNYALMPTGLAMLTTTALAPLLRWGAQLKAGERKGMLAATLLGLATVVVGWVGGNRHPLELAVCGLVVLTVAALLASLVLNARRRDSDRPWRAVWQTLARERRQYAGFLAHVGFACLALGIAGSSLGKRELQRDLRVGDAIVWGGCELRLDQLRQRSVPDKLIGEAQVTISRAGRPVATLWPAQHFHLLQKQSTTEVAIHSTWLRDFYVILHGGDGRQEAYLTFVENPMMRWLWVGGGIMGLGAGLRLLPVRRGRAVERGAVSETAPAYETTVPRRSNRAA